MNSDEIPFELASLSLAKNYQEWVRDAVTPYLGLRILELGAGIGTMSQHLPTKELLYLTESELICYQELEKLIAVKNSYALPVEGEKLDLTQPWVERLSQKNFDTVISFNVMEHIEDDLAAFKQQYDILKNSTALGPKRIVVFVPAHQWLFGTLDQSFHHFRRYHKKRILSLFEKINPQCKIESRYFNTLGVPGWLTVGRILKKKKIGLNAIKTFELICPYVRNLDDFFHQKLKLPLGQSLLSVITLP